MKHTVKITVLLVAIFFVAQVVGLLITNKYIDHKTTEATGVVSWQPLPYNIERPVIEQSTSFMYILAAIFIGTLIVLFLIKTKIWKVWKLWYFFAVFMTLAFALAAFMNHIAAALIALFFALWKVFRPNIIVHNLTEVFVYGGIAAIFVPMMNLFSVTILLIIISIYDMYAVWKSKHMITLANMQAKSNTFAGLFVPYSIKGGIKGVKASKVKKENVKKSTIRTAILGGGDIAFPLLFAGVVMKDLMLIEPVFMGFLKTLIVVIFTTIALLILLLKSEKSKFYPAMPFISAGCFVGYGVLLLINLLL